MAILQGENQLLLYSPFPYAMVKSLIAPAIRLRADLRRVRVLNVFLIMTCTSSHSHLKSSLTIPLCSSQTEEDSREGTGVE